ncbi:MAG: metallophosphoesterase [Desulfonatronovibrio sp.]
MVMLLAAHPASAEEGGEEYSFVVFGDSRIPAFAPYDRQHKEELDTLIGKITRYADPGSEPDYQAVFNPDTLLLEQIEIPGAGNQSRTISYGEDGWPTVFIDRDGENAQVALLSSGQQWVYDTIVDELQRGAANPGNGPTFSLHTGDIVYFGFQGKGAQESPYWRDFNRRFLSRLPEGGPGRLSARFFPALGNHETWGDEDIQGFREIFPYLSEYGFSSENRVYYFDHHNARFIFLDTGIMDPQAPERWYKSTPGYEEQMNLLGQWLEDASAKNKEHVFLTFHNPVFCRSGFGPLPPEQNPHPLLKSYADRLNITVFNGHVHATEAYKVDGIRYFVAGGGGGEQNLSHNIMEDEYPAELYWQGKQRILDYNYLLVQVSGANLKITLKRFRPNELQPFSQVNLVPDLME